jgi:hypothetical protein
MKKLRACIASAAAVLLFGCASGPKLAEMQSSMPALNPDQGRIYFYRTSSMMGAAIQPSVLLNGQVVGESKPGGFFYVDTAPGAQEVSTTTEVEKKLSFTLEPRQTRYVRTSASFGVLVYRVQPELVDNGTGDKELRETSYIGKPAGQR